MLKNSDFGIWCWDLVMLTSCFEIRILDCACWPWGLLTLDLRFLICKIDTFHGTVIGFQQVENGGLQISDAGRRVRGFDLRKLVFLLLQSGSHAHLF